MTKTLKELTKEELKFIKGELEYIFKCNYFNGDWEEFTQYSNWSKKKFDKNLKILNSIRKKLKKRFYGK